MRDGCVCEVEVEGVCELNVGKWKVKRWEGGEGNC